MTDETVEQQGESKRRREHPEVPQAADSSGCSSSSSESSTDTELGLVDVFTILCVNSEEEGRHEGGPKTLDLTKVRFHLSRLPDQMQNIDRRLEAAVADWITDRFWWRRLCTWHSSANCAKIQVRERRYFLHTHSHSADSWDQPTVVDFMNRFPDTFQTVTDRGLFGMNTLTRWLTNSGCIAQGSLWQLAKRS